MAMLAMQTLMQLVNISFFDNSLIQFHTSSALEFSTGGGCDKLSGTVYDSDSKYTGSELIWVKGYRQVPEALMAGSVTCATGSLNKSPNFTFVTESNRKPVNVQLNSPVTAIDTTGVKVKLTTKDGSQKAYDYCLHSF